MKARYAVCALVAACSADDGPAIDTAHTCIVRVDDDFAVEEFVHKLYAPGQPADQTWSRDGVVKSYWQYHYDDTGRLIAVDQDASGSTDSGPDGTFDLEDRYEHTPISTIVRHSAPGFDSAGGSTETTVDAFDRVIRVTQGDGTETSGAGSWDYMINEDGTVARREMMSYDPELGPFTSVDTYRYDSGRLVEHTASDTRSGGSYYDASFTYAWQPNRLVLTRTADDGRGSRWIYSYDGAGRLTRIELAEQLDHATDVFSDFTYDGDAVTATLMRVGNSSPRTYSYSSACAFRPTAPNMPTSGVRPGTRWNQSQYPFLLYPLE